MSCANFNIVFSLLFEGCFNMKMLNQYGNSMIKIRQSHDFWWWESQRLERESLYWNGPLVMYLCIRSDFRLGSSQWETSLQSNGVSYWLGANLESALCMYIFPCFSSSLWHYKVRSRSVKNVAKSPSTASLWTPSANTLSSVCTPKRLTSQCPFHSLPHLDSSQILVSWCRGIDGFAQDWGNASALAVELWQSSVSCLHHGWKVLQ